jgi:CRISPR type I-D-associated protein Csc2
MFASKQKAPESRHFHSLVRGAANEVGRELNKEQKECELKDNLCLSCPRCALFGAISTESGRSKGRWNIRHRIEYSTAYSLERWEEISEIATFNAVSSVSQSTGQALGYVESVAPLANFPSVMTLTSVTRGEFCAYLKTLMSCKSYGAETRTKGDMVNLVVGISAGYEELMTPLEYNLELSDNNFKENPMKSTYEIAEKYRQYVAFPDKIVVLKPEEVRTLLEGVQKQAFSKEFIDSLYKNAEEFANQVANFAKKEGKQAEGGGGQ